MGLNQNRENKNKNVHSFLMFDSKSNEEFES